MDLDIYRTDRELEESGVWIDIDHETRIKIASTASRKYKQAIEEKQRQYRHLAQMGRLPDQVLDNIIIEALANHILLGWEGLKVKGQEVPYSRENAMKLLKEHRVFRDLISNLASDFANFRSESFEDGAKN